MMENGNKTEMKEEERENRENKKENLNVRLQSTMILAKGFSSADFFAFFSMSSTALRMCSEAKLGPLVPPRRMTCTSLFPRVLTMAARPCSVTPINAWGFEAECMASMATVTLVEEVWELGSAYTA
jgi:hypothetical protein